MITTHDVEQREEWRRIPGFDERYEVSNLGRVRSYCVHGHLLRKQTPHIMTAKPNQFGYLAVGLQVGGKRRPFTVHFLVAAAFLGPRPEGYQVAHADGDRTNSRVENLRYATALENAQDKYLHGTMARGERNGCHKLTESQVREIIVRYRTGELQKNLARAYGVRQQTISNVVRRQQWAHLEVVR